MFYYWGLTFAFIFKKEVSGSVFEVIVTVCSWGFPAWEILGEKMTSIDPCFPGITGSSEKFGTVQLQDPFAFKIFKGSLPVFVNTNECLFSEFGSTLPKSFISSINAILANEFNLGVGSALGTNLGAGSGVTFTPLLSIEDSSNCSFINIIWYVF